MFPQDCCWWRTFAHEIVGDSMVEAGIHDGDMVIIRRSDTATSGEIVVALIEDSEATLKTFRREAGRVALEPRIRPTKHAIFQPIKSEYKVG